MPTKKTDDVNLLPTPRIGLWVQYYRDDLNLDDCAAAVCTAVEGPGKIQLAIINPNCTMFNTQKGVHWAGNDDRLHPSRPYRRAGVWDFIPGQTPRDALKFHRDLLERRSKEEESRRLQEAELRAQREARQQQMQQSVKGE